MTIAIAFTCLLCGVAAGRALDHGSLAAGAAAVAAASAAACWIDLAAHPTPAVPLDLLAFVVGYALCVVLVVEAYEPTADGRDG